MKIYFLRHGEADWPEWDRPDDERPLTRKGKKQMRKVAAFLAEVKVAPALILTSPLPRAAQTAQIAAGELGLEAQEEPSLAPGFDTEKLRALVVAHAGQNIMLVGHEPDFSGAIATLTGGAVKLSKAGVALVEMAETGLQGQLIWLIPPKIVTL